MKAFPGLLMNRVNSSFFYRCRKPKVLPFQTIRSYTNKQQSSDPAALNESHGKLDSNSSKFSLPNDQKELDETSLQVNQTANPHLQCRADKFLKENYSNLERAWSLFDEGLICWESGRLEEAIDKIKASLKAFEEKPLDGRKFNRETILDTLGLIYQSQGRLEDALVAYQQSLVFKEKSIFKTIHTIPNALDFLGSICLSLDKLNKAIEYYEQALEIRLEGAIYQDIPVINTSIQHIVDEDFPEINREKPLEMDGDRYWIKPYPRIAASLENLSQLYIQSNRLEDAVHSDQRSLIIKKHFDASQENSDNSFLHQKRKLGNSLYNLSLVYKEWGKFDRALSYAQLSLTVRKFLYGSGFKIFKIKKKSALDIKEKPHADIASSLFNVGCIYQNLGRFKEALGYLQQSLAMYKELYGDQPHSDIELNIKILEDVSKTLGQTDKT